MPLNETSAKPKRSRWPLEFDLEGIPRSTEVRQRELEKRKISMARNSFLSDKNQADPLASLPPEARARLLDQLLKDAPTGREIDLSKPVVIPYNPRDPKHAFPRMMYNHENGHTLIVKNAAQKKAAEARDYVTEPGEDWDYSKTPGGFGSRKIVVARAEEAITADDLDDLDDEQQFA